MKKILSMVLCVCLLLGAAATAEEEMSDGSFLLRIWNRSGLEISYLRFDFYTGDFLSCMLASCPNEGEDFYRAEYAASPEELKELRIQCSYGVSGLKPEDAILELMAGKPAEEHQEDAILELMAGKPAEEHPVVFPELAPEGGQVYELELVSDGEGGLLLRAPEAD